MQHHIVFECECWSHCMCDWCQTICGLETVSSVVANLAAGLNEHEAARQAATHAAIAAEYSRYLSGCSAGSIVEGTSLCSKAGSGLR